MSVFSRRRLCAGCVCLFLLVSVTMPAPAEAQGRFARIAIKAAVCGGAAWGGYKLGDKIANSAIARMSVAGPDADKVRKALQIGTAAALCGTGVLLTETIFNSLSERDRKAREKEMAAALEDANPGTRTYVLPDSKREGRLETQAAVQDGDKVCRQQVDFIAGPNEPAATRWCRAADKPNDKYELEDWKAYSGTIDAYKAKHDMPHFGGYANSIPIQSLAEVALASVEVATREKKPIDPQDVFGYAGATVEAYNRCVADGKEQLALNYTQAAALSVAVESLPERLRQQAVQACQTGVGRLVTMRTRLQGFEKELAAVDAESGRGSSGPAKVRSRDLNAAGCTP